MRVLIADRNARLLEAISRSFSPEFTILTETTLERCVDLSLRGEFDLAIVSEKLADGPGLQLLGQIARDQPNTLRVFAARGSRLELLRGKLGPLGLFRTLIYPIDPQKLLSTMMLARAGLDVDVRALASGNVPVERQQAGESPAKRGTVSLPPEAQPTGSSAAVPSAAVPSAAVPSVAAPSAVRPATERIWLTSADATFTTNVQKAIASLTRVRRSTVSAAPRPEPVAQPAQQTALQAAPRAEPSPVTLTPSVVTSPPPAPSNALQHTLARRTASRRVGSGRVASPSPLRERAPRASMSSKVVLGATVAIVFLATMLNLNRTTARAAAPVSEMQQPDRPAPAQNFVPVSEMSPLPFAPVRAQRVEPRPPATAPDVERSDPQVAASTAPVADPSTFGSEAYEPIYSN